MRVFVFFDLPTLSPQDRRAYRRFHKYLIKEGFIQLQESVYAKLTLNSVAAGLVIDGVRRKKPPAGLVEILKVTETQFAHMEMIVGERHSDILDSLDKVVII